MNEVLTFVDATHLISKAQLWEERDEAIKKKYEKLNNNNVNYERQQSRLRQMTYKTTLNL